MNVGSTPRLAAVPLLGLLLLLSLLLPTLGVAAQTPPRYSPDTILVRFKASAPPAEQALAHAAIGARVYKSFTIVEDLHAVRLPRGMRIKDALRHYRRHPAVLYAEPDWIVEHQAAPNDPSFGSLWGLNNTGQSGGVPDADIDAVEAWNITTGSSDVVVAVIDTGVDYNHQDLSGNMYRSARDCVANGIDDDGNGVIDDCVGIDTANNDAGPRDDAGHGTHVSGTIGALGNNAVGVAGVNWTVRIMACKFLDASVSGTICDAIDSLEYVKLMKDRGVNVVATNNSWGGGGFSQSLLDAIEAHLQRGILFVVAAGNNASDNDVTPSYPAAYNLPNILAVAATTRTDALASFSNFGRRTVHLGAPGQEILSTTPGNTYSVFNGTSMATPHVTGVAALLKAQDPSRDWRAIKNLILAGGDPNFSLTNTVTQRRLNARGALACANSSVRSRLRPIATPITGTIGTPIDLAMLNINCASPNGTVTVSVSPGGQTVTLLDDGLGSDQASGDGIYSGQWTPPESGNYTLTFPGGDVVTVQVVQGSYAVAPTSFSYRDTTFGGCVADQGGSATVGVQVSSSVGTQYSVNTQSLSSSSALLWTLTPPPAAIDVRPSSRSFGNVPLGSSQDLTFTVQNVGDGVVTGTATTSAPFAVVSGGAYSLSTGQSQSVTVRFSPPSAAMFSGSVAFSGTGGTSRFVSGSGIAVSPIAPAGLTGVATSSSQINLAWQDTNGNETESRVERKTGAGGTYGQIATVGANVIAYSDTGLAPATIYVYRARACNVVGCSDYSNEVTTATPAPSVAFTLSVTVKGSAAGAVTSSPAGISCASTCSASFTSGTVVTLTAAPGSQARFKGWSGACSGASLCTVTLNDARSVAATFSVIFTDATSSDLLPDATPVTALHFTELLDAINAVQPGTNLSWPTPAPAAGGAVLAIHMQTLRQALGLSTVNAGTVIAAQHINDIRLTIRSHE